MEINQIQREKLSRLPGIDHILELAKVDSALNDVPRSIVRRAARQVVNRLRSSILYAIDEVPDKDLQDVAVLNAVKALVLREMSPNLRHVVNAAGIVIHTNLGRSLLAENAVKILSRIASRYSNLEFDLSTGKRGIRYACVEDLLCEITGAPAAMVVNNNAGAVLLCLDTLAHGKQVIVSRGELVEIGGSFRIPDVMVKSGAGLIEVGTTNRTHMEDYESAIDDDTALLLKVHTSNYRIQGFTAEVPLKNLVELGRKYKIPVMEDLGSGTFIDFSRYGLVKEPTVQESVAAGTDVVTFSGDKLLGGPQAGIIVGQKEIIHEIGKNPLTRALRIDKLTLAALESTLRLYRDPDKAVREIPTLQLITRPLESIDSKARELAERLERIENPRMTVSLLYRPSRVGGGALPLLELPSRCIGIRIDGLSSAGISEFMRQNDPPVIGRIEEDLFIMDLRTIRDDEHEIIQTAFSNLLTRGI